MKSQSLMLLALVAVVLSSCLESTNNSTPSINLYNLHCVHQGDSVRDTLHCKLNEATGYYHIDTIGVGDTVRMQALVRSYGNILQKFEAEYDTAVLALTMDVDSIHNAFDLDKSTVDHLVFKEGYNTAYFPVYYVAKKAGGTKITLHLETNSTYSPAEATLYQTVQ